MTRAALLCLLLLAACSGDEPTTPIKNAPPEVMERIVNEGLYRDGLELLDAGDLAGGRAKAETLQARGQSSGYELAARAHKAAGELEEAEATLARGVEAHPGDWLLWKHLGTARTDLGRFDAAAEALARASECEGVVAAQVELERASLAERREDYGAARDLAAPLIDDSDPEVASRAFVLWIFVRSELGEARNALADEVVARIHTSDEIPERLLWLMRELVGAPSPQAHVWSLKLHLSPGPELKKEGTLGVYARARVVAKSSDDAVSMVRQLLPEARYAEVTANEVEDEGLRTDLPRGVYELGEFQPYGLGKR